MIIHPASPVILIPQVTNRGTTIVSVIFLSKRNG